MTLTKRTRGVLNATCNLTLGVTRSYRTPLAKILQVLEGELADKSELAVEHWSHVTRVEEETIATFPLGMLGIVNQELTVQGVNEICATHGTTGVTRLRFLNH